MAVVYLEDAIVFGKKCRRTSETIRTGFPTFSAEWIKDFFRKVCQLLVHIISESGDYVNPEELRAVKRMKESSSLKAVRAFLGLVGCYRKFISVFRKTADPLYSSTNKSDVFEWSTECKSAVTQLKKKVLEAPVLGHPIDRDPFTLNMDASFIGVGAILTQNKELRIEFLHMLAKLWVTLSEILQQLSGNYLQSFILGIILKTIHLFSTF